MLCSGDFGSGKQKYFRFRRIFRLTRLPKIGSGDLPPPSFRDAPLGAGPESILTIVVMDSRLVLRTPRNDEGEKHSYTRPSIHRQPHNPARPVAFIAMKRLSECFGQLPFLRFVAPLRGGPANDIVGVAVRTYRRRPGGSRRRPLAGCPGRRLGQSVEWIDKCVASHFRPTPCSMFDCDQFTTVTSIFNLLRTGSAFCAVKWQFGHKAVTQEFSSCKDGHNKLCSNAVIDIDLRIRCTNRDQEGIPSSPLPSL
jgi:hypothetical protein